MGHGLLGKVLSNPIVDAVGAGALGFFAPEILGGLGSALGGGAAQGFEAAEYGSSALAGSEASAAAADAGAYGPGIAANVGVDVNAGVGLGEGGAAAAGSVGAANAGAYGPGIASNVEATTGPVPLGGGGGGAPSTPLARLFSKVPGASTIMSAFQGAKGGLGAMEVLSGLYALEQSKKLQAMTRPPNPADLAKMPGYQAGLEAVERSLASQGYQGSGNMMAALQKYGGDAYSQMWQGDIASAQAAEGGLGGQLGGLGLLTGGLSNLMGWNAPGKGG